MIEVTSPAGLAAELSNALARYLAKSCSNSLSKVQFHTGIDFKTLKKIMMGNLNVKNINPLKLAKLSSLTGEKIPLVHFMQKHRNELDEKQVDFYLSLYADKKEMTQAPELESDEFEIYTLCANIGGIGLNEIRDLSGIEGLRALEKLLEKDLVELRDEKYVTKEHGFHFYERDSLKKHVTEFSKKIRLRKKSGLNNYLMFAHESLNLKGVEMLEELTCRYHQEVMKIFSDKYYQGKNPYFLFLGYDSNIDFDYTQRG